VHDNFVAKIAKRISFLYSENNLAVI